MYDFSTKRTEMYFCPKSDLISNPVFWMHLATIVEREHLYLNTNFEVSI